VAEKLIPRGTVFTNHTNPPGLEGLYTVKSITETTGLSTGFQVHPNEGGWDRFVLGRFTNSAWDLWQCSVCCGTHSYQQPCDILAGCDNHSHVCLPAYPLSMPLDMLYQQRGAQQMAHHAA
jgi:hypothetical protein